MLSVARDRAAVLLGAVLILALAAGCGGQDVTRPKLERDVASTFVNLRATQLRIEGRTVPTEGGAIAVCRRVGSKRSIGPGKDWRCTITVPGPGVAAGVSVRYALTARANACYTATRADFEHQHIRSASGRLVKNPLYIFDGCLSA